TLQYKIPVSGMVAIKLFDLLGRELKIMINEEKSAGTHELHLDGSTLSSGIYFCRLQAGKFTKTIKMQLLK
ncbi:MAG: T9SS type A sorting domain-containing protein, partial [Methanococcaceae archaeon]